MVPSTLSICRKINETEGKYYFKSLFDSGATEVMVKKAALPTYLQVFTTEEKGFITTQGRFTSAEYVYLNGISFPELSYSRQVKTVKAYIFHANEVRYDIIFGRKFMHNVGIDLKFTTSTVHWFEDMMNFHPLNYFKNKEAMRDILNSEPFRVKRFDDSATKYKSVDLEEVIKTQIHLSDDQKKQLQDVLVKYDKLFAGLNDCHLGQYPNQTFHITLKPDARPYHVKQPFPIPVNQLENFKTEIHRQVQLGILSECADSEWGLPTFCVPKPDNTARIVADL